MPLIRFRRSFCVKLKTGQLFAIKAKEKDVSRKRYLSTNLPVFCARRPKVVANLARNYRSLVFGCVLPLSTLCLFLFASNRFHVFFFILLDWFWKHNASHVESSIRPKWKTHHYSRFFLLCWTIKRRWKAKRKKKSIVSKCLRVDTAQISWFIIFLFTWLDVRISWRQVRTKA